MDHRYIDDRSVADRYLDHTLSPEERAEFETHLVDCQECTDRLLLAEMFHNRNGAGRPAPEVPDTAKPALQKAPPEPIRIRFVRQFSPAQIAAILGAAAALLVLATAGFLFWVLRVGSVLR